MTDLNTDCNPQGPQQGWTSSADGCQLYHTSRKSRQWRWGAESRQQAKGREGLTNQTQFPPPGTQQHGRREKRWGRSRVQYVHANVVSSGRTGQEFSHHRTIAHAPDDIHHPSYFRWGKRHIHPKLTSPSVCLFYSEGLSIPTLALVIRPMVLRTLLACLNVIPPFP